MTTWWNKNAENRMNDFVTWVGESDQPSKIYCRGYVAGRQYKNIIDCGCGLASEYFGYKEDNYQIEYTGLDSCVYFVEKNRQNGIAMVEAELEADFPIENNFYECAYCREVIEHLSYYEKAISEMIRIASKEVIIVMFIKPTDEEENIDYWEEEDLYHNTYNKGKLEQFILGNEKVASINWRFINDLSNRVDIVDAANKADGYAAEENTEINPEPTVVEPIVEAYVEAVDTTMESTDIIVENTESAVETKMSNIEEEKPVEIERPWIKTPKTILHIILKE